MTTYNTNNLEHFVVCRDGNYIDEEYYDTQYSELRKQIIHEAASKVVHTVLDVPKTVGHNLVSLVLGR